MGQANKLPVCRSSGGPFELLLSLNDYAAQLLPCVYIQLFPFGRTYFPHFEVSVCFLPSFSLARPRPGCFDGLLLCAEASLEINLCRSLPRPF